MDKARIESNFLRALSFLPPNISKIVVGLSGGADSVTLLHLLVEHLSSINSSITISAVYIHHGLNQRADDWGIFCQKYCQNLNVDFYIEKVKLNLGPRVSIEAEAREKRYQALQKYLDCNTVLATAHHANDLTETFFLALKRGSGLPGIAGMGVLQKFEQSYIWRPLLSISRKEIEEYTQQHNLSYVTDDSNFDTSYDRNFFRHNVIPTIENRFPEFLTMVGRTASFAAEAQELLQELAKDDLDKIKVAENAISIENYLSYSIARRHNFLRVFVHSICGRYPTVQLIEQIEKNFILSSQSAQPCFCFDDWQIRRFQNAIYIIPTDILQVKQNITLQIGDRFTILGKEWEIKESDNGPFSYNGGEILLSFGHPFSIKLHPYNRNHSRELKKLFSEYNVPTWERSLIPLVFENKELLGLFPYYVEKNKHTTSKGFCFKQINRGLK